MTYQNELHAAAMRLRNSAYLYRRAASSPRNKRAHVAAFNRQLMQDRALLKSTDNLPKLLPKHARPIELQSELEFSGSIAC